MRYLLWTERLPARLRRTLWASGLAALGLVVLVALTTGCRKGTTNRPRQNVPVTAIRSLTLSPPNYGPSTTRSINPALSTPSSRPRSFRRFPDSSSISSGYRPRGEKRRSVGGDFRSRVGRRPPAQDAEVELDKSQVEQAQQLVVVAESNVQMAKAQLAEAKANVGKSEADVVRWDSEVKRLTQMVKENVVDKQVLADTEKQLDSSRAARDAAQAAVAVREADRVTSVANLGKAKIDVQTQKAQVKVSEADERKAAAMLAYTKVTAPYDGVVTVRNANTGDYVQAVTGDKSTANPSAIFVVARVDLVRVFVDVPEAYARYVQKGTKARGVILALSGLQYTCHRDPDILGDTRED